MSTSRYYKKSVSYIATSALLLPKGRRICSSGLPGFIGNRSMRTTKWFRKGKSIVSYINMYCIIWKCAKRFLTRSFHWRSWAIWLKRTRLICRTWSTATSVAIWKSWWTRIGWNMPRNCSVRASVCRRSCPNAAGFCREVRFMLLLKRWRAPLPNVIWNMKWEHSTQNQ